VDPNEPLYCICQQISFGEMIACDNNSKTNPVRYYFLVKVKFIFFKKYFS